MLLRLFLDSKDRQQLQALDATTTVDCRAALKVDDGTITWMPVALPAPRRKTHDLTAYLDEEPRPWEVAYVAESDHGIVGFAAIRLESWNCRLILWHLYVDAAARGRGVARELVAEILASDLARGARQLWLETQDDNVPSIRAYERMGFEIVGFDRSLYANPPESETAIYMSYPLE